MEPETTTTRAPEEGEATQKILRMISDDAVAEGLQTSELVQKVRESITEISANRKPRKRARLRESVDWTAEGELGAEALADPDATAAALTEHHGTLDDLEVSQADREGLLRLATDLAGSGSFAAADGRDGGDLGAFALNAVVVLAKAALRKDGEKHNTRALQKTLETMHTQYTSLANETCCLQTRLKREKDACVVLERDVDRIRGDVDDLRRENDDLKRRLRDAEGELRCGICYEARKNCVLLPCLHHLFCAECLNTHFSTSQARTCPVCRKGVSGVLVLQLE